MTAPPRPAPPCGDRATILRLASLRARDEIDPSGEGFLRAHLAGCSGCFAEAVGLDPALLFARISASAEAGEIVARAPLHGARAPWEEPPESELLAADVLAAIRVRAAEAGRRPAHLRRLSRHWLRAAAVVLLATGLAAVLLLRRPEPPARGRETALQAAAPGAPSLPLIEDLATPGARVYEFAASTPEEPAVVFVANPDADL